MNKLQEIINEMEADLLIADKAILDFKAIGSSKHEMFEMFKAAINKYIPKLKLLLSEGATEGGDKDGKAGSSTMA